jgi:hypothetical protein
LLAACLLSFRPIYEPDLWWHLAQGRENAAGRLVRTNVFSFNYPDYPQQYTSWLFDTAAFAAWTAGDGMGVQILQAALLALTFALLYAACRVRSPAWSAAAVLILAFFVIEPRAIPRPHLVSFAGLAACALLVERAVLRRTHAPLWWSVPLIALWSNFHVECVFGVILVGAFALSEVIRPRDLSGRDAALAAAAAAAGGAATLANPYGWGLVAYLYENWSVPQLLSIAELQPPPLPGYRAFYAWLVVCAALGAWRWRTLRPWQVFATVAFAALGARYLRLTPLVLFASAPMLAAHAAALTNARTAQRAIIAAALVCGALLSRLPVHTLVTRLAAGTPAIAPPSFFSPAAIEFAERAGLAGPLFNSHNLGGYVAWTMYPRAGIFQDSRLQAYPPEHFLSILVASRSPADWKVIAADVDWAMLSLPRPNQLSGVGQFPPEEWRTVFRDQAIEIVVRRGSRYDKSQLPNPNSQ